MPPRPRSTCLVVGDANADVSASVELFPREGDDAGVTSLGFQSGGTAANVAVALARLGHSPRLLARVGDDPAADVALRAANHAHVDLSFVQRDSRLPTGLCFAVISPGGERTFFSYRGANVALGLPDVGAALLDVSWVHVSGHALLEGEQRKTSLALMEEARRRGLRVSIDLCMPLARARASEILALAPHWSVLFANARELSLLGASLGLPENDDLIDATLSKLLHAGTPVVVAKLGANGSRVATRSSRVDGAPLIVKAVDTTGAGDGFVAAFLLVLLRGGSPRVAARLGNLVGALVASRPGAAEAAPYRDELRSVVGTLDNPDELMALLAENE